jgi:cytochrome c553
MRASAVSVLAALAVSWCMQPAWAQDAAKLAAANAGRAKAQPCVVCHGMNGISTQPDAPHLAGQPAFYLRTQLKNYRSGERKHAVMAVMAKPLTDEDIEALSQWFASIKLEATVPP